MYSIYISLKCKNNYNGQVYFAYRINKDLTLISFEAPIWYYRTDYQSPRIKHDEVTAGGGCCAKTIPAKVS